MKNQTNGNYFIEADRSLSPVLHLLFPCILPVGIITVMIFMLLSFFYMYQKYKQLLEKYKALEGKNLQLM